MLLSSNDEKLAYFWRVRVKHPRVASILDDLGTMVLPGSGTDIALVIGPTGAGKTTLGTSLLERIIKAHHAEMLEDLSFIPAVMISAPSSGEKKFAWRIFYIKLGKALIDPLIDKKQEFRLSDGRLSVKQVTGGSTVAGLRMAVEDALRYRNTLLVIIDEAVHLIRNARGDALAAHMDALKALTVLEGVNLTLALIGSYDLYQLMGLSGQVARRTAIVHFQRYRPGIPEDEKAFTKSIAKLQAFYPIKGVPDLTPWSGELIQSCIGCVGTMKETMQRALAFALLQNNGKWSDACLAKALLTEGQVTSILEETLKGEVEIEKTIFGSRILIAKTATEKKAA